MQITQSRPEGHLLKGLALASLAVFMFAVSDVLTKHLTTHYPVAVVVAVRYLVNLVLLLVIMGPGSGKALWRTHKTGLVIVRAVCLALASLTLGLALRVMPVAETVAIVYLSPFLIIILSVPLLGEKVSAIGWIGAIAGFCGVLIIIRPGGGLDAFGVILTLINAGLATAYALLSRYLSRTESTRSMLFHAAAWGSLIFVVMAIPELGGPLPEVSDMMLMLALGAVTLIGHLLFTVAFREAPASLLAPINYLHLVWAAGLGWLVFGQLPDVLSSLGIAMIIAAGSGVALYAHFSKQEKSA